MNFYDLDVHTSLSIGENTLEEMAEMAKRLGLAGIGVVHYYSGGHAALPRIDGIDIVNCLMIKATRTDELNSFVDKARPRADVLLVHGGNYDVNRAACENSAVDVLCHAELGRKDSGLDHVCVRAAHDNNVAIEINFREVLESYKRNRIYVLSSLKKNIGLCAKYETPVIVSSSAVTKWGLRGGRELAAIAHLLGLELGKAIDAASSIPEQIVNINREKHAGKRYDGVKVVDDR
ncbi:MAG TPA: RNase P subunit p30 family protein [archaeon]|nr:RNase P subunit p30 family protein [archaeon]